MFDTADSLLELDHREADRIAVTLLWNRDSHQVIVRVRDDKNNEEFDLDARPEEALPVFHHPYAYAASRPIRYRYVGDLAAV